MIAEFFAHPNALALVKEDKFWRASFTLDNWLVSTYANTPELAAMAALERLTVRPRS